MAQRGAAAPPPAAFSATHALLVEREAGARDGALPQQLADDGEALAKEAEAMASAVLSDAAEGLEAPSDDLLRRSREIAGELSSTSVLKVRVGAGAISFFAFTGVLVHAPAASTHARSRLPTDHLQL